MEESKKEQLESDDDTPSPLPQSQELSYFLKEKEPENEGTSNSTIKQERNERDYASSSLNQSMYHTFLFCFENILSDICFLLWLQFLVVEQIQRTQLTEVVFIDFCF